MKLKKLLTILVTYGLLLISFFSVNAAFIPKQNTNNDDQINADDLLKFIGQKQTVCSNVLDAGTYYIHVYASSSTNDIQRYRLTVTSSR